MENKVVVKYFDSDGMTIDTETRGVDGKYEDLVLFCTVRDEIKTKIDSGKIPSNCSQIIIRDYLDEELMIKAGVYGDIYEQYFY